MFKSKIKLAFLLLALIVITGFLLPQELTMPVENANTNSYDQHSYWAYPWGQSVTHKGVDIFARNGTVVHPATAGLVVFAGQNKLGGNVVYVLGPKWRLHYYAHLKKIQASSFSFVRRDDVLGTVGSSGNAKGKPPHLHYTIQTIFPYIWQMDTDRQGWKKMIYINPIPYLNQRKVR